MILKVGCQDSEFDRIAFHGRLGVYTHPSNMTDKAPQNPRIGVRDGTLEKGKLPMNFGAHGISR